LIYGSPGHGVRAQLSEETVNATILWLIAVVLVVVGIVFLFTDRIILGIILIIVGLLVGPGGVSIFKGRSGRRL